MKTTPTKDSREMVRYRMLFAFLFACVIAWANTIAVAQEVVTEQAPVETEVPAEEPAADESAAEKNDEVVIESAEVAPEDEETTPEPEPPAEPEADPENPGLPALDRAVELKLEATDLKDLNEIVDLLDEAREEGLDAANSDFAEQVLVATLLQRSGSLAQAVLKQPITDPRRDPRWLQIRQFALTDLQRVVALDETQGGAWLLIGRLQSLPMGSPSEARRALSKVIRLAKEKADDPAEDAPKDETIAQAYALRGAAQKNEKDRIDDFTNAIELDPSKAEYLLLRAQAHRAAGRPDETLADIEKAIELAPENPKVYELKALALLMQERQEEALEAFNKASELAPQLLTPYQYRGELYSQLGELDKAIEQLDKALELQPNNLASLLIRSQLLSANEQHERALADIDAILRQQPGLVRAHQMKAKTLDELGRTDEAVAWLERLVAADPDRPELQLQLAVFYVDKQMAPEAIEVLTSVLDIDPGNELALRLRGDMLLYKGDHEAAVEDFEAVLELNPLDAGVLNNYAWTLATSPFDDVRDGEKAVELATKACEVTEYGAPHILSTLAAAHAEAGDYDAAIKRSEEAVAKAEELGTLDGYDGQLEAELNCYRSGEPWRELQKLGVAGPATEAATQLAEAEEEDAAADEEAVEEEPTQPQPGIADEAPARSLDF
ncbi:MAG: tetratricopeptide repeat protein [Planctomycetota bacterium]